MSHRQEQLSGQKTRKIKGFSQKEQLISKKNLPYIFYFPLKQKKVNMCRAYGPKKNCFKIHALAVVGFHCQKKKSNKSI